MQQTKCFISGCLQLADSEEDSDVDTGFYSDGEEAPPAKRKSLLVALRCVPLVVGSGGGSIQTFT